MGKLKQSLPHSNSNDNYLFLAIFLIWLLPSMREAVGSGNQKTSVAMVKGTVPQDFLPLVFFFKQLLLASVDKPSNDFNFFFNIRRDIQLFRCFAGVNDSGKWHFYCFRALHRCQQHRQNNPHRCHWHRQSMHSPVSMTPAKHVFAGVNDTGEACHQCHWHRWRHASLVSLIPGSKYRQLRRCQWHRRSMSLPMSMTPAMHALLVSLTPLMHL